MKEKLQFSQPLYADFPNTPGVYLMKDERGHLLYVGKAGNLRRRVASYFSRAHDARIERLMRGVRTIEYIVTSSALEALIKEASIIKRFAPPYNIKEKDDKSFLYVEITKEEFPRVILVRGTEKKKGVRYGPFVSASEIRQVLTIVRRIFPFSTHTSERIRKSTRPCLDYELRICPGVCGGKISRGEYFGTIRNIKLLFAGKKEKIIALLVRDMEKASDALEFERAERIRCTIFALRHIRDTALIGSNTSPESEDSAVRIEGYDISAISGTSAVGGMVVFRGNLPLKDEYRKFKIRTVYGVDDTRMLREVLERRFTHEEWPLPNLVFVDGGKPQVNTAKAVLREKGIGIPVIGIAKGPTRKKIEFVGASLREIAQLGVSSEILVRVRDEAHRFAVKYHREVRARRSMK